MTVFGSGRWREKLYHEHRADLETACKAIVLGPDVEFPKWRSPFAGEVSCPLSTPAEQCWRRRRALLAYPAPNFGKSGIFAAYAAHGLVPVTFAANTAGNEDGLGIDDLYITASGTNKLDVCQRKRISQTAHEGYKRHALSSQAVAYAKKLLAYAH